MHVTTPQGFIFLREFARSHDDIPAFHAAFLVFALLAAAMFNLGVFAVLIVLHMGLDFVKYRDVHHCSLPRTAKGMLLESLPDLALLMIGLSFSVFVHHSTAVLGVSGLLHANLTILRSLGVFLPKVAILEHIIEIIIHLRRYLRHPHPDLDALWTTRNIVYVTVIALCVVSLFMAGPLTNTDSSVIAQIVWWELTPWNL